MQYKNLFTGAAVLLASVSGVSAVGSATVVNNCGFPVYYASVGGGSNPGMQQLQGSYSQTYSQQGVGVSIKLSPQDSTSGAISQFEFTWANGKVAYDMSNINGNPFSSNGMEIVPSMQNDPNNPTCVPVSCPAGQAVCAAAYNQPDDVRTMVCNEDSNLVLTLCPGGAAGNATFKRSISEAGVAPISRAHARHFPAQA